MKNNINSLIFSITMYLLFGNILNTYSSYSPIQQVSTNDKCYYKITGTLANGASYSHSPEWKEIGCSSNLDMKNMPNGIGKLADGTYTIYLKGKDKTVVGDGKNYIGESNTEKSNKYGITTWGTYKIDTQKPTCLLKEIRFLANSSDNQYYHNGKLYYKGVNGKGKFELQIESDDTGAGPNTSRIDKIVFPTILGANPTTQTFTKNSTTLQGPGKVTVVGKYEWNGSYNDTFDILNNSSKLFCYDVAGNSSPLNADINTKIIFQDGNHTITGLTSLVLTPDNTVPTVNGITYQDTTNGISYKSGNDGNGSALNMYNGVNTNTKFLAALDNRTLILPYFTDNGAGLKSFKVGIEKATDKTSWEVYNKALSSKDSRITTITDTNIIHDFSLVDGDLYPNDGYRPYSWYLQSLNLGGNDDNELKNKICDMVGNCITIATPDIKVLANSPIIATNTSFGSSARGTKHNLNVHYNGDKNTMRSNLRDTHISIVIFKDMYNNDILPVSGAKEIKLNIDFYNSLGCDQYEETTRNSGDCVDFRYTNETTTLNGSGHTVSERKNFNYTLSNWSQFKGGDFRILLQSAIPTKNEYTFSGTTKSMYGPDLDAKLQLTSLKIKINDKTGYNGVGENNTALEVANTYSNKPSYKWYPVISYDYIDSLAPLVEGQQRSLKVSNLVTDSTDLKGYKLDTRIGTNNFFLRFNHIYLSNGNLLKGGIDPRGSDNYVIYKNLAGTSYSGDGYGNGNINYSGNDIYNVSPKTIGGITNSVSNVAFYSKLTYTLKNREVFIPSLQSGFKDFGIHAPGDFGDISNYEANNTITFAEVDIRGITQTRNQLGTSGGTGAITTDNNTFRDISNITLLDLKTQVNKNVKTLLAGHDLNKGKVSGGNYTLDNLSTFPKNIGINEKNGQILYFKDTNVTIDCGNVCIISGNKTLIVENGNIFVKSDLKYADNKSIIGFVLIGNTDKGNTNQFRISEEITNGVGIVYSEGPVVSVTKLNEIIYNGQTPENTSLVNQLYWLGSFATRNTIGGAIKGVTDIKKLCPYGTPEYRNTSTCTIEKAQGYDLIYLRRYARVNKSLYGVTNNPMGDNKVPLSVDKKDIKTAGGDLYKKINSTMKVIKIDGELPKPPNLNKNTPLMLVYDGNLQLNPPLGFSN